MLSKFVMESNICMIKGLFIETSNVWMSLQLNMGM